MVNLCFTFLSPRSFFYICPGSTGVCSFHSIFQHWTIVNINTPPCISLSPYLGTISANVVSSTYFHEFFCDGLRSLIIRKNNPGPNFVPCGTPDRAAPHSEKQSLERFSRCSLFDKKSHTQRATSRGILRENLFSQDLRSPWIMEIKACVVDDLRIYCQIGLGR